MKKYIMSSAFVQGRGHIKNDTPCQDRTYCLTDKITNTAAITLSDGAGSCQFSHIGAEIVTKKTAEILIENFEKLYNGENDKIKKFLISNLILSLNQYAEENDIKIRDLSSTLLFVATDGSKYLAGHLGDGVIGYKTNDNKIGVLSHPDNGEYSNTTFFVTENDSFQNIRIYKDAIGDINGFVLMSDGTESSLYNKKERILTDANLQILNWSLKYSPNISKKALQDNLENVIKMNTFDDCSISLINIVDDYISVLLNSDISYKKEYFGYKNDKSLQRCIVIMRALLILKSQDLRLLKAYTNFRPRTIKRHIHKLESIGILKDLLV